MDKESVIINLGNLRRISHAVVSAVGNMESASRQIAHAIKSLAYSEREDRCMSLTLEEINYAVQEMEAIPYKKILSELRIVEAALGRDMKATLEAEK